MDPLDLVAAAMVGAGALIMVGAIAPVRALMLQLTSDSLRQRWMVMAALIGLFLVGYLAYLVAFWGRHQSTLDLIVPAVFLGAPVLSG